MSYSVILLSRTNDTIPINLGLISARRDLFLADEIAGINRWKHLLLIYPEREIRALRLARIEIF